MNAWIAQARARLNALGSGVPSLLWYLFLIVAAYGFASSAVGHLRYLFSEAPRLVTTPQEALKLSADRPFLIRLPLDWKHGLQIEGRSTAYTLVPVAGTQGRLVVARKGHAQNAEMIGLQTLRGRVIASGLFGDWDAGALDSTVDLPGEFRRIGYEVPADALLLVVDWPFDGDAIWQLAVGLIVLALLSGWLARRLLRLRRRGLSS